MPGEHLDAGLRGRVAEVVAHRNTDAVDRADHDDATRVLRGGVALQLGQQFLGQHERRLDVDVHHLVEALFGELAERSAPGGAGVVDQDVDGVGVLAQRGDEGCEPRLVRHVGRDRGARRGARHRVEFGCRGVACLGLARGDEHVHAIGHEAGGDHVADAARAAGHDGGLAGEAEQAGEVEVVGSGGTVGLVAAHLAGCTPSTPSAPNRICQKCQAPSARCLALSTALEAT